VARPASIARPAWRVASLLGRLLARPWIALVAALVVHTALWLDGRELTPDLPCAAAMARSILCLARRDRPRGAGWVAGAAVLWFAAFQIKEVAVWCAPAWIYAALRDLRDQSKPATLGRGAGWPAARRRVTHGRP
jgi:hypothetical protein